MNGEHTQGSIAEEHRHARERASPALNDTGARQLAALLRLPDLSAAWQVAGVGQSPDHISNNHFGNHVRHAKASPSRLTFPGDVSMHVVHDGIREGTIRGAHVSPRSRPMSRHLLKTRVLATMASTLAVLGLSVRRASAAAIIKEAGLRASSSGFVQAFLLVFLSELGDKTFFLAALLAAKFSKKVAFIGSIAALAAMTIISTMLGQVCQAIPAGITQGVPFADIAAVASFTFFGLKTLYDAATSPAGDSSGIEAERIEAEAEVERKTSAQSRRNTLTAMAQTFGLIFAAEIGDRSFISTVALAAALNPIAVGVGAILAHASATGIAVLGGALVTRNLSEKVIGYIGGSLFLVFALTTALGVF